MTDTIHFLILMGDFWLNLWGSRIQMLEAIFVKNFCCYVVMDTF